MALVGLSLSKLESGNYISAYWKTPHGNAKYIRMNVGSYVDLVVKVNDKGSTDDRAEYTVVLDDKYKDEMSELLTAALGDPIPLMFRFTEWFVGRDLCISIVQNLEQPQHLFVEVEGPTQHEVDFWVAKLNTLQETGFVKVKNSMYDIFVLRQGILF